MPLLTSSSFSNERVVTVATKDWATSRATSESRSAFRISLAISSISPLLRRPLARREEKALVNLEVRLSNTGPAYRLPLNYYCVSIARSICAAKFFARSSLRAPPFASVMYKVSKASAPNVATIAARMSTPNREIDFVML